MRKWLKEHREAKGLSMKEIAEKLDISESYYCSIENGHRQKNMDIALAASLSSILDIPIVVIVRYESEIKSAEEVTA